MRGLSSGLLIAIVVLGPGSAGAQGRRCPTERDVVRLRQNVRATIDRAASGAVCWETLEPCTDAGEYPARLPSGDPAIMLDPAVVNELITDVAPAARTGASRGTYVAEFGRVEVRSELYEHATVSRTLVGGRLESVNVSWLDTECVCDATG